MLKKIELLNENSCLNKADSNEPIFVIRAKDRLAPMTLRHWAAMADGIHEPEKISEALELANEMDRWRTQPPPAMPMPYSPTVTSGPIRR